VFVPCNTDGMATQIVLVPGFWLGAWAWDDVAPHLLSSGFVVTALTLPGLEPDHDDRGRVTLDDHADAIIAAFDGSADRRVLVVHSGAAIPGTIVLDRRPELVDRVVFVDTAPVRDGFAMSPDAEGAELPIEAAWDDEVEQGSMRDLSDDQLTRFRDRAVPQPIETVRGVVHLTDPQRLDVPATVIATSFPAGEFREGAEAGVPFLAGLLDHHQIDYVELPTGHWPMWSRPAELAALIAAAATR
jgi:pimeloyl-ACP methyl ester carboxylesterase